MRASLDSRWFLLGLAASLTLAGCGNGSDQGSPSPPYPLYDTGVIRAVKVDAAVEHALDGAGEANPAVDGGVADGTDASAASGDAAGDAVDAASLAPSITVIIDTASLVPPGDGGVSDALLVPSSYGPKPTVMVTVVSNSGDMRTDDVSSVIGLLKDPATGTTVATVKPARSETDSAPESNTTFVIFSGVPLDLSNVGTGSYDLVCTATTVGGTSADAKVTLSVDTGPTVVVNSPVEGGYYKGSAPVEVDATQPRFAITSVTMAVGQGRCGPADPDQPGRVQGHHRLQQLLSAPGG